jgi:YD repeat-containing protein
MLLMGFILGEGTRSAPADPLSITYTYDAIGRLTSASYGDSVTAVYTYDASSNITSIVVAPPALDAGGEAPIGAPKAFAFGSSVPNPFAATTGLTYALPAAARVNLAIYDTAGRGVRRLVDAVQAPGYYVARWDGRDESGRSVANGMYFLRLVAGEFEGTRRVVLLNE